MSEFTGSPGSRWRNLGLLGLAVLQPVAIARLANSAQGTKVGSGDLAPPAAATREPEAEWGAISNSCQAVVAGGQHGLQPGQGDRSLLAWALAARLSTVRIVGCSQGLATCLRRCAVDTRQQFRLLQAQLAATVKKHAGIEADLRHAVERAQAAATSTTAEADSQRGRSAALKEQLARLQSLPVEFEAALRRDQQAQKSPKKDSKRAKKATPKAP